MKRARDDTPFRAALVEKAVQNVLDGDVGTALSQPRDVVNATMAFEVLASVTGRPKTSLMRLPGQNGNPRADNLGAILRALGEHTGGHIVARVDPVRAPEPA